MKRTTSNHEQPPTATNRSCLSVSVRGFHHCKICGQRYNPYYLGAFHRTCKACVNRNRPADTKEWRVAMKTVAEAHRAASVTSDAKLATAKTKPPRTSDVRWRIELRRRANAAYFADYGAPPDAIR